MFRSRYVEFDRVDGIDCSVEPSRTKQEFKDECDINQILASYEKTGRVSHLVKAQPRYGDFSSPVDFQQALNLVSVAHDQFSALPAKVRAKFLNDPVKFLEFVSQPENEDELVDLGLAVAKPVVVPEKDLPKGEVPAAGEGPKT